MNDFKSLAQRRKSVEAELIPLKRWRISRTTSAYRQQLKKREKNLVVEGVFLF